MGLRLPAGRHEQAGLAKAKKAEFTGVNEHF
jgi:hypothetical protein